MMAKGKYLFLIYEMALLFCPVLAQAQDAAGEDIIRIKTRVVFINTLVKDKKTGLPVVDLTRENFEVLADGKPRSLSYFSREGSERGGRPLALLLVLDLWARDANDYLRLAEIVGSLTAVLKKLPPEDEVAVVANLGGAGAPLRMLTDFTRDRTKVAEALSAARSLPLPQPWWYGEELESILQKVERAASERTNSQIIVVPVTTFLGVLPTGKRDDIAERLIRANALFSPLISNPGKGSARMRHVPGKYPLPPLPVFGAIERLLGKDIYAPQHIAQQTGGEAASVRQPEDYGAALEKLIASLAARYNLGFALNENERDDGRLHRLEVRVKVRDSRGSERKLITSARRGYYIPKAEGLPVPK